MMLDADKWLGPHRYKELHPDLQKEVDGWINSLASTGFDGQRVLLRAMWAAVVNNRTHREPQRLLATIDKLFGPYDCLNNGYTAYVMPRFKVFKRGRLEVRWRIKKGR